MTVEFEILKPLSKKLIFRPRLSIKYLEINIDGTFKKFENFYSESIKRRKHTLGRTGLNYIFLDTGNITNYSMIPYEYLNPFNEEYEKLEYEDDPPLIVDIQGNEFPVMISKKIFEFRFCNTLFKTKLGFRPLVNVKSLDEINIGIEAIKQFINVILPSENCYYYFCANY